MGGDHTSTILHSSNLIDQTSSYPNPTLPNSDFPSLPPHPTPNQTSSTAPSNPSLHLPNPKPDAEPLAPSPNVWKNKPPNFRQVLTKKIFLRFIPPSARDSSLVGICPSEAVAGELQILDLTLVGFFLGRKPGFSFVRTNLLKQWKIRSSVQILQLIQGGLAFRFSDIEDRDQILETGVFYVGGQSIFFRSWERNIHTGGILGLKQIPLWVSLPGLPLHLWGEDSLSAICSVLGKPLYSDRITAEKSRWSFARACVEFSGASPLLDSITIEDDVGNIYQQPVKYDWKPPHCISCGIFGHLKDSCMRGPGTEEQAGEEDDVSSNQNLYLPKDPKPVQATEEERLDIDQGVDKEAKPDHPSVGKGKTFSELLQKRTSVLLRGWNPIRVKKTGSGSHDPTRSRTLSQPIGLNSVHKKTTDHVSNCGASAGGPPPYFLKKDAQSNPPSSPPCLENFSKFKLTATNTPSLTNRFGILDLEESTSPCPQPFDRSLSDCSSNQGVVHDTGSKLVSFGQPCEGINRNGPWSRPSSDPQIYEGPGPGHVGRSDHGQAEGHFPLIGQENPPCKGQHWNHTQQPSLYLPPSSPKPVQSLPSNDTDLSSAGRTPYHSRIPYTGSPFMTNAEHTNQPRNMANLASLGADFEQRENTNPEYIDEGLGKSMPEPNPLFADAIDEAVQDNIEEEEDDLEEEENEDYTEEDDKPSERDKEEEDAEIRKRLLALVKDDDRWVTTTNQKDPRRIRIC